MTDIEDKIKELNALKCRVCKHFIRVNFEGYHNVPNRQGFCILGQLEGDFGLYVSSSISKECMGYVFDKHTCAIAEAEKQLSTDLNQFIHDLEDGRTSTHKLSEPLRIAQKNYIKAFHGSPDGTAGFMAMQILRKEGVDHFRKLHEDRYMNIYRMVSLQKTDYNKFLAQLTHALHDELCVCEVISAR